MVTAIHNRVTHAMRLMGHIPNSSIRIIELYGNILK